MLNKMFMFHYQLNQNTGCKVSSAVNMKRQVKTLSNRGHRRQSEQPFYLPEFTPGLPCRWCRVNFRRVTPSLPRG